MIVITAATHFIASALISKLNAEGYKDLIAVADFSEPEDTQVLQGKTLTAKVQHKDFTSWLAANQLHVEFVFHFDVVNPTHAQNTCNHNQQIWKTCQEFGIPFVYASNSAANIKDFKAWIPLSENHSYGFWAGLQLFDVYSPFENPQAKNASLIAQAFAQINSSGKLLLPSSEQTSLANGEQMHDCTHVKDVIAICYFLMHQRKHSGIYAVRTGTSHTLNELAALVFKAMKKPVNISFVQATSKNPYQPFSQDNLSALSAIGYKQPFISLAQGITDTIGHYVRQATQNV